MKKRPFILLSTAILLTACDPYEYHKYSKVNSDFSYTDENVKIVDNLESVNNKKAHIIMLYGQSNADGVSSCAYLEKNNKEKFDEYTAGYNNVFINYYNDGGKASSNYAFQNKILGCGCTLDCFGPEAGIADEMSKAYPNETTFIVKWTFGATRLRTDWLDNHHGRGNLYNPSMDFTMKCLDYISDKGYTLSLDGICWMQGESDSYYDDEAAYFRDSTAFAALLRHDLSKYQKDIKFIDAGINEDEGMWPFPEVINNAKKSFANMSQLNYFLDTNVLGIVARTEPEECPDYGHYDSLSMVKLGQEFAKIAIK